MTQRPLLIISFLALFVVRAWPAFAISIPTVPIGNPGNPGDERFDDVYSDHLPVGAVSQRFVIGKTEVTNSQYVAFLNAVAADDLYGLYSANMSADTRGGIVRSGTPGSYEYAVKSPALDGSYSYDNKPVIYVSWADAARFINWVHNKQPIGQQNAHSTEDGAYTLNGAVTNAALKGVNRNSGARWWIPNEDEWYKAAYHKNDRATGNYWNYPTASDSPPDNNLPLSDTGNSANYWVGGSTTGAPQYPMTDSGAYLLSGSSYGTFDQGGNVWEWTETRTNFDMARVVRGGSYGLVVANDLIWWNWGVGAHAEEVWLTGFRVAGVPEPGSAILALIAGLGALFVRCEARRKS